MKNYQVTDVDSYLQAVPENVRLALANLRATIKAAAPQAEESISYMMPGYKYLGPLVYFAALKNHLALYGATKNMLELFKTELRPYKISGTAIHFTPEQPLPDSLIQKIVTARIRENEERKAAKVRDVQVKEPLKSAN
ncbi:hypothetical protein AAE02nite_46970 [Adhaeribacter aerolatus]|uniref:YdhG-like domain-containing protein n=1 Tax=Adhaeribacter aerolatus TaxID=670289 RepID=A0A512B4X1_9BACT|nr:DUF1801 domain-containing protein [Adhaeribacter aerolatus]GEO07033.1 hypothetical protein AAE02nite_46970 [Adhaeribacter aerolatus]